MIRHLRHRPSLLVGSLLAILVAAATWPHLRPVTALLVGWDVGVMGYGLCFLALIRCGTPERLQRVASEIDEGSWLILLCTLVAAIASLGAIVVELAQIHGKPHTGWQAGLAGVTVIGSWFFVHTMFATHYAHAFWRRGGLTFPGNDRPGFGEFLYFSICMAVAAQVSDVTTQSPAMRQLVLAHSLVAYLFNTAIIALGVNIAASLSS